MKCKHLAAPKSPKSSAWGYLLGLLGLLGAGVSVILEIQPEAERLCAAFA